MSRTITNVRYDFSDKVVLVTGGARGQGRSHGLAFARAGADVAIFDVAEAQMPTVPYALATAEDLTDTIDAIEALDRRCVGTVCDVRDSEQVTAAVAKVIEEFGHIDILINNAGVESVYSVEDLPEEAWDTMLGVHLKGSFLMTREVSRQMIAAGNGGRIITVGSINSILASPRQAHYTAAKHGLSGLNKASAVDLARHRITCNLVCPGSVDTPMTDGLAANETEWLNELGGTFGPWNLIEPDQKLASEEISNAILWLASDAAAFVTGQAVVVDAGYSIK
jgi:NAD(P)-dependent dehydrogenase (short-subunit alcohol dehydrogenase family)